MISPTRPFNMPKKLRPLFTIFDRKQISKIYFLHIFVFREFNIFKVT